MDEFSGNLVQKEGMLNLKYNKIKTVRRTDDPDQPMYDYMKIYNIGN